MAHGIKLSLSKGIILFCIAALLSACKGGEIYPIIPSVEYDSYYLVKDGNGQVSYIGLIFKYKDGDGDIGLEDKDTVAPFIDYYANNVYVDYLEKRGNNYEYVIAPPASGDTMRREFKVMNITPEGKFKAIRGTIDVQFPPSKFVGRADTVKVKFFLIDRSLHLSNVAESADIILSSN